MEWLEGTLKVIQLQPMGRDTSHWKTSCGHLYRGFIGYAKSPPSFTIEERCSWLETDGAGNGTVGTAEEPGAVGTNYGMAACSLQPAPSSNRC